MPTDNELQTRLLTEEILLRLALQPLFLALVEVCGGEPFSSAFFAKLLGPLVNSSDYTLGQLIKDTNRSRQNLVHTDVFSDVKVLLQPDFTRIAPKVPSYNKEKPISTKVIFDLEPVALSAGEGVLSYNNKEHLNVKLDYLNNNFNGNAELVRLGVDYSPYKPAEHLLANGRFVAGLNNPAFKVVCDLFNTQQDNHSWQQAVERVSGGLIGVQYRKGALSTLLGLSLARRTVYDIGDGATDAVKAFGGDYVKLLVLNQLTIENLSFLSLSTRNFPTEGYLFGVSSEFSSSQEQENPLNQTTFGKTAASLSVYKSFFNNAFTAHVLKEAGAVYGTRAAVHVSDRFYLGGFQLFRGFGRNAVNVDGGLQFYKAGLTLYSKLPSFVFRPQLEKEENPLRLYATGLVGNVSDNVFADVSGAASAGFGLSYFNRWASFDAGYFASKRIGDESSVGITDGFQIAVSIGGSNRQ